MTGVVSRWNRPVVSHNQHISDSVCQYIVNLLLVSIRGDGAETIEFFTEHFCGRVERMVCCVRVCLLVSEKTIVN